MKQPDPKAHLNVSLIKSLLRILAAVALGTQSFELAGGLFIIAEICGIVEELV